MLSRYGSLLALWTLAVGLVTSFPRPALCQQVTAKPHSDVSRVSSLKLASKAAAELRSAIRHRRYRTAEKILLPAIAHCQEPLLLARLLAFTGSIYYLDHDFLHAAVAWNKSAAIAPLPSTIQFSLAMDYIQLRRPSWAHHTLQNLAKQNPHNALYPYWLGRIEYGAHRYNQAIRYFRSAIHLAPHMGRAYDNLGLCYYYINQNSKAILNYKKAIALNLKHGHPSAWPYLNLAITQEFLNRLPAAQKSLEESIRLNPNIPMAYFQLGNVLEHRGQLRQAVREYQAAIHHDATYAKPHFALARIYQRLGKKYLARKEVRAYLRLRHHNRSSQIKRAAAN